MDCSIKEEEPDPLAPAETLTDEEFHPLEHLGEFDQFIGKEEQDPLKITEETALDPTNNGIEQLAGPSRAKQIFIPLRRSQRRRSLPVRDSKTLEEKPKKSAPWTKVEKAQLLEGLKIAGDSNILDLVQFVPTKSPHQVEFYINHLKRKSSKLIEKDDKYFLLELWSKKIKQMSKKVDRFFFDSVPIALLLISLIEEFPSPQQANGVYFKGLYEYLFCILSELPLPQLDRKTKQFLHHSLQEIEKDIRNQSSSLLNALLDNSDLSEWPFNSKFMNPLYFPQIELNLEND